VTAARHRVGSEFRVDGTSTIAGNTAVLSPATVVVVYSRPTESPNWTKAGTRRSTRPEPGPCDPSPVRPLSRTSTWFSPREGVRRTGRSRPGSPP
jgi:hypothetical protein